MEAMKSMNFRRILFLGVLVGLGCAAVAQAQFAAYGMVNGENLKGITCLDPQGQCAASNGTFKPYGGTVGAFYDWRSFGPLRLGVDVRGTFMNSSKSAYSYMAARSRCVMMRRWAACARPSGRLSMCCGPMHRFRRDWAGRMRPRRRHLRSRRFT